MSSRRKLSTLQSTELWEDFNTKSVLGTGIQWDSPSNAVTISLMHIICLIGMVRKDGERGNEIPDETIRKGRARILINNVNPYNDLARTAKEVGNHLGRTAVT